LPVGRQKREVPDPATTSPGSATWWFTKTASVRPCGNRHGFLAFSEIHPDYYQIPKEDRDALLREEAEHAAEEAALRAQQEAEDDLHDEEHEDDGFERDSAVDDASADRFEEDSGAEPDVEVVAEGEGRGGEGRGRRRKRTASDDAADDLRERRTNLRHRYKIQDVRGDCHRNR